ncbi:MAG TPA: SPOR domain-containing protein [Gemmatimonadaceae bacterium]|nr:SPOR domain-containing protein [Gemmatimonadaceae bacterium]
MRTTLSALALALAAAGCGSSGRDDQQQQQQPGTAATDDASTSPSPGPDPIVLRVARTGGIVRAFAYPRLDSAVWKSADPAPAIGSVLAFDQEGGSLAIVDAKGLPERVDLRSGGVSTASRLKLASLSSADGYAIYGINAGAVTRLTPTGGAWPYKPPAPARDVVPQPDGSVLVVGERGGATTVWHVRPPDAKVIDSATLARTRRVVRTEIGDRVYFTSDSGLIALRGRDLKTVPAIHFDHAVRALAPTPSGDRLYVATDSSATLTVVNRYTDKIEEHIELPGPVADLRMDPLGRYVLARAAGRGSAGADSAWVVAIGNNHVVGAVRTAWLADLPFVAPDGMVAVAQGADVVFVDGETLAPKRRVANGAKDFWHVIMWNGFRPRAAGLDQPVTFRGSDLPPDSTRPMDSMDSAFAAGAIKLDSGAAVPPKSGDSTPPRPAAPASPSATTPAGSTAPRGPGFTVQFASVLTADKAREVAATISADGRTPRVVETSRNGATIYRVVLGPYTSKAEADRIGRASGKDFWVFEGTP